MWIVTQSVRYLFHTEHDNNKTVRVQTGLNYQRYRLTSSIIKGLWMNEWVTPQNKLFNNNKVISTLTPRLFWKLYNSASIKNQTETRVWVQALNLSVQGSYFSLSRLLDLKIASQQVFSIHTINIEILPSPNSYINWLAQLTAMSNTLHLTHICEPATIQYEHILLSAVFSSSIHWRSCSSPFLSQEACFGWICFISCQGYRKSTRLFQFITKHSSTALTTTECCLCLLINTNCVFYRFTNKLPIPMELWVELPLIVCPFHLQNQSI